MASKGAVGVLSTGFANSLPAKVVMIYLGLAVLATLLAFSTYDPLYFMPLMLLAAPVGIMLLDHFEQATLLMQTVFVIIGIGVNAWIAGMIAAGIRHLRTSRAR